MKYILAVDIGTTAVKTALFNDNLQMVAKSTKEYSLILKGEDFVELNSSTYIDNLVLGINEMLDESGLSGKDVIAIGLTSQGETLIPVSSRGEALGNAIVWFDTRAKEEATQLGNIISDTKMYNTTGIPNASAASSLAKLMWLKNNRPEIFSPGNKVLLLLDYLVMQFTGRYVTDDVICASTNYFDINNNCYFKEALEAAGILEEFLPPTIISCGSSAGGLTEQMAKKIGLCPGIPVYSCGIDQAASAVGSGNVVSGMVTATIGTALVFATVLEKPCYELENPIYVAKHYDNKYLYLPYATNAGIILKWFKDEYCQSEHLIAEEQGKTVYQLIDEMADSIAPSISHPVLLPHFSGMTTPEYNFNAKGVFYGIGLGTDKAVFTRCIMESIAYTIRENIEKIQDITGKDIDKLYLLGGGSKSAVWCHIIADVIRKEVVTLKQEETTLLGVAIMSAISSGLIDSYSTACQMAVAPQEIYLPDSNNSIIYEHLFQKYTGLYNALKDFFDKY